MLCIILVALVLTSALYLIKISKDKMDYWKKRNVKHIKPFPFVGNLLPVIRQSMSMTELILYMYNRYPDERYVGFYHYGKPVLFLRDLELIKSVAVKNFDHFVDHEIFVPAESDPLWGRGLFASEGDRWRQLRQTLSPVFTGSKLRTMFVLVEEITKDLINYFIDKQEPLIEVELKDVFTRYANDVIATTAFGIKCNSLESPNNEFLLAGRDLANFATGWGRLKLSLYESYPKLAKFLNLKMVNEEVANFFRAIINETIELRERKNIVRPDLIHLMMLSRNGKLKYEDLLSKSGFGAAPESGKSGDNIKFLSNEDITAQTVLFFLGGYDTVSAMMAFVGYELAVNPDIQEKLRTGIIKTHNECSGKITYEKLLGIKYLDMVISETLRMWPQAPWLNRKCTRYFEIKPERSGESVLKIHPGDIVWIPAIGVHKDPKYYTDPDRFQPERLNDENGKNLDITEYLAFGIGPRNCIASRFALLEAKILFYYLLLNFELVPLLKTDIPLRFRKDSIGTQPANGFHIGFKRLPPVEKRYV